MAAFTLRNIHCSVLLHLSNIESVLSIGKISKLIVTLYKTWTIEHPVKNFGNFLPFAFFRARLERKKACWCFVVVLPPAYLQYLYHVPQENTAQPPSLPPPPAVTGPLATAIASPSCRSAKVLIKDVSSFLLFKNYIYFFLNFFQSGCVLSSIQHAKQISYLKLSIQVQIIPFTLTHSTIQTHPHNTWNAELEASVVLTDKRCQIRRGN